jgi:hypothetical protein
VIFPTPKDPESARRQRKVKIAAWASAVLYSAIGLAVGYAEGQLVGAIVGAAMGLAMVALGIWGFAKAQSQDR